MQFIPSGFDELRVVCDVGNEYLEEGFKCHIIHLKEGKPKPLRVTHSKPFGVMEDDSLLSKDVFTFSAFAVKDIRNEIYFCFTCSPTKVKFLFLSSFSICVLVRARTGMCHVALLPLPQRYIMC